MRIANRLFVFLSIMYVSACAGVASLPYYSIDRSGNQVETRELCVLYFRYGFWRGESNHAMELIGRSETSAVWNSARTNTVTEEMNYSIIFLVWRQMRAPTTRKG